MRTAHRKRGGGKPGQAFEQRDTGASGHLLPRRPCEWTVLRSSHHLVF